MQNSLSQIVDEMDLGSNGGVQSGDVRWARPRQRHLRHLTGRVAQGDTGLPIFIGVMQLRCDRRSRRYPDLREGDVVILNDPTAAARI